MKRLLLAHLLALPAFAQSTQDILAVSVPSLVRPGQVLDITVKRTSNPQPPASAATQLSFTFSGNVTAISVNSVPPTKLGACNLTSPTTAICIVYGLNTDLLPDGIVMIAHATLGTNQNPNFTITNSNPVSAAPNGDNVTVSVNPTVSVSVQSKCDINGDGQTNATDVAAAVVQTLGGGTTADVNLDGRVDARDVQWIAAALNGGVCR